MLYSKMNKIAILAVLLIVFIELSVVGLIAPSRAQSVGPAYTFNDISLSHSDIAVYTMYNGSMSYVSTINSTSTFVYDPTSDYTFVFQPSLGSSLSSPSGISGFISNNPEFAALLIGILFILVIVIIFIIIAKSGRR